MRWFKRYTLQYITVSQEDRCVMSKRFRRNAFLAIGVLAITVLLRPSATFATTYYIDPSAASQGNGTLASPFNDWNLVSFKPGNTYLQKAGTTYSGLVALFFRSRAQHPCLSSSTVTALALPQSSQMLSCLIILHTSNFSILPSPPLPYIRA
jgi:hypothetical protein